MVKALDYNLELESVRLAWSYSERPLLVLPAAKWPDGLGQIKVLKCSPGHEAPLYTVGFETDGI